MFLIDSSDCDIWTFLSNVKQIFVIKILVTENFKSSILEKQAWANLIIDQTAFIKDFYQLLFISKSHCWNSSRPFVALELVIFCLDQDRAAWGTVISANPTSNMLHYLRCLRLSHLTCEFWHNRFEKYSLSTLYIYLVMYTSTM